MLVGRHKEIEILNGAFESARSEFIAVYGRRRVGKTFLVRETFGRRLTFQHSGLAKGTMANQLAAFHSSLCRSFSCDVPVPKNWLDAFDALATMIERRGGKGKAVHIAMVAPFGIVKNSYSDDIQAVITLEHLFNGSLHQ